MGAVRSHAMALDGDTGNRVARIRAQPVVRSAIWLALVAACGPAVRPEGPESPSPSQITAPPTAPPPRSSTGTPGRQWLVGEMCPQGAAGRPAVLPLFLRSVGWSADPEQVEAPLARGAVGQFAVLAIDGRKAGVFSVVGVADAGLASDVAVGTYAGGPPCATASGPKAVEDPVCARVLAGCGVAVASIEPGQGVFGNAETAAPPVGAACVGADALAVDVDGDGTVESYPLAQLLDPMRAPADELTASPGTSAKCTPHYSQLDVRLTPGVEPGGRVDPKYVVQLDVLGVVDVDGDGRRELVLAYRYPEGQNRTVALYSATATAGRLELVGEATPWQR